MTPLSERGNPLLWRDSRLLSRRTAMRRLRNGCSKAFYRCRSYGCPGVITLTESHPDSNEFIEEGTLSKLLWTYVLTIAVTEVSEPHICDPDPLTLLAHLAKQKYKLLSEDINLSANEAYRLVVEELQLHHPEVLPRFESLQTLSSMGHRSSIRHSAASEKQCSWSRYSWGIFKNHWWLSTLAVFWRWGTTSKKSLSFQLKKLSNDASKQSTCASTVHSKYVLVHFTSYTLSTHISVILASH